MSTVNEKIAKLREVMKERNIFAYYIPSSDFHESEYVGSYFKSREFVSGFTGSAGLVVVTQEEAILWTDGRYFIQAEQEIEGTELVLFRQGEKDVKTPKKYLEKVMPNGSKLGFDGRVINAKEGLDFEKVLSKKEVTISYNEDLVDLIWENRPELPKEKSFLLDVKYAGKSTSEKLVELRKEMKKKKSTSHILTTLDDIAWLYNFRGRDIKFSPVTLAYSVITESEAVLFVDKSKLSEEICAEFAKDNVEVKAYNDIYEYVKNIEGAVLVDLERMNYAIYKNLPKDVTKVKAQNPTILSKAIKNSVEIENIRNSHLKDGVACTKFMIWLKQNIGKTTITEITAAQKMEELRKEQDLFIEPSFNTISAYKDHAAMMHYSATEQNQYTLEPEHLYLIDSGGQYFDGTTDITRTIALGEVDEEIKKHFTAVVRGMLTLSNARFLHGVRGLNLDILARKPLWDMMLDYRCGTGHGIGFLLNVHEAPNGFRWKIVPERNDSCELEVGMVTTNEPGVYVGGSHGIRIENELIVQELENNEYGQFLHFETVTFAPIDLDAINPKYMNEEEKQMLNNYHKQVFEKISPFLSSEEQEILKGYTKEI
ncbi:MAG: peptidase M24 [Epulopiscium sp. Nele67-Bin005]|nr:MAG: peptidase M24 [Epulopiscium sp. Nele67-Bin005]